MLKTFKYQLLRIPRSTNFSYTQYMQYACYIIYHKIFVYLFENSILFETKTVSVYFVFKYDFRDISMNHIKQLPETLFQSSRKLVLLHLYDNKIEVLPKSIFKGLSQLEDLDLSANLLSELSSDIFQGVVSLKRLKLQENQLQQLPLGNVKLIYFFYFLIYANIVIFKYTNY